MSFVIMVVLIFVVMVLLNQADRRDRQHYFRDGLSRRGIPDDELDKWGL